MPAPLPPIAPTPELRNFLLRAATTAAHQGPSIEALETELDAMISPIFDRIAAKTNDAGKAKFGIAKMLARSAGQIQATIDSYLDADMIADGKSGRFDSRSLSCWIEIAKLAGVPFVPATRILTLPEPVLDLVQCPDAVEAEPASRGLMFRLLDNLSGGALRLNFGMLDEVPVAKKREFHQVALAMLAKAGDALPPGHMVRHDQMGPATLKSWAGLGWEPWDGDDGVTFRDEDRQMTLGPGWVTVGNRRFIDVTDARTVTAIALAFTRKHSFYSRPWMKPARRYGGYDVHRPTTWSDDMRRGSWPAEWRVFLRGGKAVAVSAYYPWADIPGDETDHKAATAALALAQRMADAAHAAHLLPSDVKLDMLHKRSQEAREMLPPDMANATLDFIETENGLMFLEGAMAAGPGGYGAHPCATAGQRWATGIHYRMADGVDIAQPKTWGEEALSPFKLKAA